MTGQPQEHTRDQNVDFLRFVGLAMIILAHVDPPAVIFQLRNFDVPLMVMVAGISFALSYRGESYGVYFWKRVNRLVFPVWIFLSFYFSVLYITGFPTPLPAAEKIASSYLLLSGIGYVWIIRVFLLVALVSPLLFRLSADTQSQIRYFAMLAAGYLLYALLRVAAQPLSQSFAGQAVENTLFYLLPYGIVFAIGLRLPGLRRQQVALLCVGAMCAFALLGAALYLESGKIVPTQEFKYPPSAYYLSFALGVSTLLWLVSRRAVAAIAAARLGPAMRFVAQNSIWIYLWHIPMIEAIHLNAAAKYPLVFLGATLVTWAQVAAVERMLLPRTANAATRKSLRVLFTG